MLTEEQANAVRAFVARRRPVFVRQEYVASRRLDGEVDYDGRDARGFGAVLVYVQQGLGDRFDDILSILRAVHRGQSGYHIRYPVCLFSFGGEDGKLHHVGHSHTGEPRADVSAWAKELCELSGTASPVPCAEMHELLPWSEPLRGKRRVERRDLAVFICASREVTMPAEVRSVFLRTLAQNAVWVFMSSADIAVELGIAIPSGRGLPE